MNNLAKQTDLMKPQTRIFLACLAGALFAGGLGRALAGPLKLDYLPAETRWAVHWDVERFLQSRIGKTVLEAQLERRLDEGRRKLREKLGLDLDWRKIRSFTLYGCDYQAPERAQGVLLVDADWDLEAAFQKAIQSGKCDAVLSLGNGLYSIHKDIFVAAASGKPAVLGGDREKVEAARRAILNRKDPLSEDSMLARMLREPSGGFLTFAARRFAEEAQVPPEAQILRMTDALGGSLAESTDRAVLTVSLRAKSPEVSRQVEQVVRGLLALATLKQDENPDLKELVDNAKIVRSKETVKIRIAPPLDRILEKLREAVKNMGAGKAP